MRRALLFVVVVALVGATVAGAQVFGGSPPGLSSSEVVSYVSDAGTLAEAHKDLYVNTIIAGSINQLDGGAGEFAFICNQSPCKLKLEPTSQSYLTASANTLTAGFGLVVLPTTTISQPGNPANTTVRWLAQTAGTFFGFYPSTDLTGCAAGTAGGVRYLSTINALVVCNGTAIQRLAVDTPTTLPTCAAGIEGLSLVDAAAGGTTGARTRRCLCTSDGGGTPAYAWQNLATGTVDTATTCAP